MLIKYIFCGKIRTVLLMWMNSLFYVENIKVISIWNLELQGLC